MEQKRRVLFFHLRDIIVWQNFPRDQFNIYAQLYDRIYVPVGTKMDTRAIFFITFFMAEQFRGVLNTIIVNTNIYEMWKPLIPNDFHPLIVIIEFSSGKRI